MSARRLCLLLCILLLRPVIACGQQTSARGAGQVADPTPLASETAPRGRIGHEFTEPPPVPHQSAPQWLPSEPIGEITAQRYTLGMLLSLACQYNPTIRQARLHITAQLARAQQAGLYPNPVAYYVGEQIGLEGTAGEWQGGEIEQRFVTAGKLELSRDKYLQRAKVAEHLAVAQQFRVCNDVRIHFMRSLAALQIVDLRRELLKTAEDHVLTVREMYNVGQANQVDALQANALLQKHRLEVLKSENDVRRHLVELTALVGLGTDDPLLDGCLESHRAPIDFEEAYAQLLQCSPQLLATDAKLREDGITLERERVQWVPDIVVSGGAGYDFVDRQTNAAAGVSIEIPLFDRNQGTIKQAQADYARQQSEIRRARLDLRRRLAMEYHNYLTASQHVVEYDAVILPSKRIAYQLSLESYKANRAEWPDVLRTQEDYTTARIEYVDQQLAQRVSEILIDGYLLHGGLQAPMGPLPAGHIDSVPKPR